MKSDKILILYFTVISSISLRAQQSPTVDPTIVIQRAQSLMGCGIVTKETTITVSGSLKADSLAPMPITLQSQGDRRWRTELDTPKEHKITVVNEGKGQMQHGNGRITKLAEHNTSSQRPTWIPCLTSLGLPPAHMKTMHLRTEALSGDSVDVIDLWPVNVSNLDSLSDRRKTTVWISRNTGYLIRMQYINAAEQDINATYVVTVDYFDYRVVDTLLVPFRQQVSDDGKISFTLTLDAVHLNTPVADFTLR
jgi:hypothetical protein